jgi:chromate transport protein ChrA
VPPFLILPLAAIYTRVDGHPGVKRFSNGLMLGAIGLMLGAAAVLSGAAVRDAWALAIIAGAAGLALTRRVPTIAILVLAALAGVMIYT